MLPLIFISIIRFIAMMNLHFYRLFLFQQKTIVLFQTLKKKTIRFHFMEKNVFFFKSRQASIIYFLN